MVMKRGVHTIILLTFLVGLVYPQQERQRYSSLLQDLKLNIKLAFQNDNDLKRRELFKNNLLAITALLKTPKDLAAYVKELVVNVETIVRWGRTEESKKLIQESIEGTHELLTSIAQNYTYLPADVANIKDVADIIYQALNLLNGVQVGERAIDQEKNKQELDQRNYSAKMQNLFVELQKSQLISFSDKATTQKFIKQGKAFAAELTDASKDSVVYLKKMIADLEGIMNTGFSTRTKDIVLKGINRLKESIENAYRATGEQDQWYQKMINLMRNVILRLDHDYMAKNLEEEKKQSTNDTRSPQEMYNQSKQSDSANAQIAAHAALIQATDVQAYNRFFSATNQAVPLECKLDENKSFNDQLVIAWPCKMRYLDTLVKKYSSDKSQEFKQLDSIVLKLMLFIKNKSTMTDAAKKQKLDELKKLIEPLKNPKKGSFLSKIKSVLPGNKKKIEEIMTELKKAIVLDVQAAIA